MPEGLARPLSHADYVRLDEVLAPRLAHYKRRTGRSWLNSVDLDVVRRNIREGVVESRMIGGILVLFTIGSPWYSDVKVLAECMCLRLWPGGDFADVPVWLEQEARLQGCVGVSAGTALSSGTSALIAHYEAAGWNVQAHELYKELV